MDNIKTPEEIAEALLDKYIDDNLLSELHEGIIRELSAERNANLEQIRELEEHLFTCQGMLLSDQTKLATANAKIVELENKCKNLDGIIGSLDVKDPNACDALLNVQLINQNTIHELKLENKALRDMYDGTQIVLSEVQSELSTANEKAEKLAYSLEWSDRALKEMHRLANHNAIETIPVHVNSTEALKEWRGEK